jgi:hypothetical protein
MNLNSSLLRRRQGPERRDEFAPLSKRHIGDFETKATSAQMNPK